MLENVVLRHMRKPRAFSMKRFIKELIHMAKGKEAKGKKEEKEEKKPAAAPAAPAAKGAAKKGAPVEAAEETPKKEEKKKEKKSQKERPKSKKKHTKVQIWKLYKVEGNELKRKNEYCPRCGAGTFLASYKNRKYCGKCSFSEITMAKQTDDAKHRQTDAENVKGK